jgi:hypothetical protein
MSSSCFLKLSSTFVKEIYVDDDYDLPYLYWIPKLQTKIHGWLQKMF